MSRLTDDAERSILSFIRAGGFPHTAAEAAGVPRELFDDWLSRPGRRYREFALAVRQASAQARLRVEVAVIDTKPLDWLKSGPGKPQPGLPGWTAAARAAPVREDVSALEQQAVQEMMTFLITTLSGHPDARVHLGDALSKVGAQRRSNRP
jgi:hypothetical protein